MHGLTVQFTVAGTYTITLPSNSYKSGTTGVSTSISITTTAANEVYDLVLHVTSMDGSTLRNHFTVSDKY
jgi:hypothetical protein